ncbi:MAG: hypothetical protein P8J64_04995 [Dehalococcoidia bacterium]|jgi:hypothetical protein|nr:hypothetical protein [Dehalococcoidia bacterium]
MSNKADPATIKLLLKKAKDNAREQAESKKSERDAIARWEQRNGRAKWSELDEAYNGKKA